MDERRTPPGGARNQRQSASEARSTARDRTRSPFWAVALAVGARRRGRDRRMRAAPAARDLDRNRAARTPASASATSASATAARTCSRSTGSSRPSSSDGAGARRGVRRRDRGAVDDFQDAADLAAPAWSTTRRRGGARHLDAAASVATWYGPGFFGNETACGQTLHPAGRSASPTRRCPAARRWCSATGAASCAPR